eukprot:snap_masked-scaffold_68-processed-gene-0.51-mRNA-1 protein AED:0.37 eAED:0.39 QI:0/-1/0/1/-1/1/1/0/95
MVERKEKNNLLVKAMRSSLKQANLSVGVWSLTLYSSNFVQNRICGLQSEHTPYQKLMGHSPDISNVRVFGSIGYAQVNKEERSKLQDTGVKVRFV